MKGFMILVLSFGISAVAQADMSLFKPASELDHTSMGYKASEASKRVMVLYVGEDCEKCDALTKKIDADKSLHAHLKKNYDTYQVNASQKFTVYCTTGDVLQNDTFLDMKGINELPAVVYFDRDGAVELVVDDVQSTTAFYRTGRDYAINQ